MKATVLDLRYKTKEVLKALDRREKVTLLYHGKAKGEIVPVGAETTLKVGEHASFGMAKGETIPVAQVVDSLRGARHDAL